jgi:O-antigen/teichoic acid export membrane protein
MMTLFIQAFRFAAEPFFFAHAEGEGNRDVYAVVMKYFVIVCAGIFLLVMLYMDIFQRYIGPAFRVGLPVVPILLMANLFLGVYVNLSIWYKLSDRTLMGAVVSLGGAAITIVLNVLFIPKYGYMASAWATLACYASMAVASYLLGQKYYPVNYDLASFFKYMVISLLLYFGYTFIINQPATQNIPHLVFSTLFMLAFAVFVWLQDGKALLKMKG